MENEEDVIVETTNDTVPEIVETPADTSEETDVTIEVDAEQLQATNKKLYERAKKAEAELKALRGSTGAPAKSVSPQLGVEEAVLLANGMSEELLGELKAVAKVRGTSLIKAQADPIFVAVKEKFEKDKKQKDASLPASRGASAVKAAKTANTPGLTREEHKALALSQR